jgi:hypothetical protein
MSLFKALFKKPNGIDELSELREQYSNGGKLVVEKARSLARAAETVSRQRQENELAEKIARFRIAEGLPEGAAE